MRVVALNALTSGISRLRTKGGADPQTLYDLENAFVTIAGTIKSRPGTVQHAALPAGTKGLCAFNGGLVVFSDQEQTMPDGFTCEVLTHPTNSELTLAEIHFAGPFLGYLYVVAEWSDSSVFHYWLRSADEWQAETAYKEGDLVQPTEPNGFVYRAYRLNAAGTPWAPNVARTIGDVVEPTTPSGYQHTVVDTLGTNPRSGEVEPGWATTAGGITIEDADNPSATTTAPVNEDPAEGSGYCVCGTMLLDGSTRASDVRVGDEFDCWTPERGFYRGRVIAVGEPRLEPCVILTTDCGTLWCSESTTFTLPDAPSDQADGFSILATDMLGRTVHSDDGVQVVRSVVSVGEQIVVPMTFEGGASFAAGADAQHRVFSHNMAKMVEP